MSKAWGHTVRLLTEQEISHAIEMGKSHWEYCKNNPNGRPVPEEAEIIRLERKCRISSKCQNQATKMLRYKYITGRAGRISWADKPICDHHASKYETAPAE